MRKIFANLKSVVAFAVVAAMTLSVSCMYDDTALTKRVDKVEKDLAALTEKVNGLNGQEVTLDSLLAGKLVITGVTTNEAGDTVVSLSNGESFTVLAEAAGLQYRTENDVLEISADGETWVAVAAPAEAVVKAVVVNKDGSVTLTLADDTQVTVGTAELIEFEATRTALYVKAAETVAIPFAINDAVEDINVMNQPLGWKASVESTRAVGGMDYVLNITGPSKDFLAAGYAEKSGKVSVHFNTAAGACKVLNVDVNLAELTMSIDKAGNITIENTLVDRYIFTDWYGESEEVEEFNNFVIAVFDLDEYLAIDGDLESVYNANWGEFEIPCASGWMQNIYERLGNTPESGIYQDGVNEKWTVKATVKDLIATLDWYGMFTYEGNSFAVCAIPTDVNNDGLPILSDAVVVKFEQLVTKIEENVENRAFNNVYFDVKLRGAEAYHFYPVAKMSVDQYIEYGYATDATDYFMQALQQYLEYPAWYPFGMEVNTNIIDENISLADLLALSGYSYELAPATDYVMCVLAREAGKTEYTADDLIILEFATVDIVPAETAIKYSYEVDEDYGLFNIAYNVTVPENVALAITRWYDEPQQDAELLLSDMLEYGYSRNAEDLAEGNFTFYVGTGVDNPATTKYLVLLLVDAEGNYTLDTIQSQSAELVYNTTYTPTIESVEFTAEFATITVGGLEGAEVKGYQYYIVATDGNSYYQRTEEELADVAYASNFMYKSSEENPIVAEEGVDYQPFAAGKTYKVAVGVQFADGTYSNSVYGEYEYVAAPVDTNDALVATSFKYLGRYNDLQNNGKTGGCGVYELKGDNFDLTVYVNHNDFNSETGALSGDELVYAAIWSGYSPDDCVWENNTFSFEGTFNGSALQYNYSSTLTSDADGIVLNILDANGEPICVITAGNPTL